MAVPNILPLLGSISGMLAGPELSQRVSAALGIAGTPAGNLVASASPKSIGAGIASLAGGARMDDTVRQVLSMTASEAGSVGQPQMPMGQQPQMPMGQPPQMPMGQQPQMPMGQPQPSMQNPFPQVPQTPQQPTSLGTGLGTLRPRQGEAMPPMTRGFV